MKAIPHFMPNILMHCNELTNPPVGNPTKSILINDLNKRAKKKNVQKQFKPSQAWKLIMDQDYKADIQKCITIRMLISDFLCHQVLDFK